MGVEGGKTHFPSFVFQEASMLHHCGPYNHVNGFPHCLGSSLKYSTQLEPHKFRTSGNFFDFLYHTASCTILLLNNIRPLYLLAVVLGQAGRSQISPSCLFSHRRRARVAHAANVEYFTGALQ